MTSSNSLLTTSCSDFVGGGQWSRGGSIDPSVCLDSPKNLQTEEVPYPITSHLKAGADGMKRGYLVDHQAGKDGCVLLLAERSDFTLHYI